MPASSQAGTPVPFSLHPPLGPVLPRIPKGARLRAASELEARLNRVLSSTGDLGAWSNLLDYGGLLTQPGRGGARRNLTTQVVRQLDGHVCLSPQRRLRQQRNITKRQSQNPDEQAVKRASFKLQEGDVRGAARCLTSQDSLAPSSPETLSALRDKHPSSPANRRPNPSPVGIPLSVTEDDIRGAIRNFPPGSAGGYDGLKPQHLKDVTSFTGGQLCASLANFTNLVLSGGVPLAVRPFSLEPLLSLSLRREAG